MMNTSKNNGLQPLENDKGELSTYTTNIDSMCNLNSSQIVDPYLNSNMNSVRLQAPISYNINNNNNTDNNLTGFSQSCPEIFKNGTNTGMAPSNTTLHSRFNGMQHTQSSPALGYQINNTISQCRHPGRCRMHSNHIMSNQSNSNRYQYHQINNRNNGLNFNNNFPQQNLTNKQFSNGQYEHFGKPNFWTQMINMNQDNGYFQKMKNESQMTNNKIPYPVMNSFIPTNNKNKFTIPQLNYNGTACMNPMMNLNSCPEQNISGYGMMMRPTYGNFYGNVPNQYQNFDMNRMKTMKGIEMYPNNFNNSMGREMYPNNRIEYGNTILNNYNENRRYDYGGMNNGMEVYNNNHYIAGPGTGAGDMNNGTIDDTGIGTFCGIGVSNIPFVTPGN